MRFDFNKKSLSVAVLVLLSLATTKSFGQSTQTATNPTNNTVELDNKSAFEQAVRSLDSMCVNEMSNILYNSQDTLNIEAIRTGYRRVFNTLARLCGITNENYLNKVWTETVEASIGFFIAHKEMLNKERAERQGKEGR